MTSPYRPSRVYVIQHTKHNVVSALQYGDLIAVLDRGDEPDPLNISYIAEKMRTRLADFSRDDFLVLVGSPIAIAIASAVVAERTGGRFKLLKWDQAASRYFVAAITLESGGPGV